jgi:glycine/D-amino acid oxidase-like deaminating enzyme
MIQRSLIEWFPMLESIRFEHAWGGPVGMPRDWLPSVRFDPDSKIGMACGYTGQGVVLSHLAGRMMAGSITGKQTGYEPLPIAGHRSPSWVQNHYDGWLCAMCRTHCCGSMRLRSPEEASRWTNQ